ncbi:hypothetical protein ONS95_000622 [Cadophora gregata]|uniref:uncharacterized protein n=1 Tax=Cadophora gregata TaxID=51156 RepID=UPI0026DD20EC|nr:uncharacterized protein ONS95_000622 [Cadophora gregata]KAK0125356.1 hypothetical protein ONS96_009204 [Cadophora gregata f. sp. sojae]KAK0128665.1 hypothetical protein ONS95_000622 [Cadophora gregata]
MSFLTATTEVNTKTTLAPHITKAQALSLLHNDTGMLDLNPSKITYTLLPASTSTQFYSSVPAAHKPPTIPGDISTLPVFHVTEHQGTSSSDENEVQGGHWKGSWIKRFVPNELTYQTSVQHTADGMISITHAPMGVQSVTTWVVRDPAAEGEGCVLEKTGKVWSNRALMGFIKGGLQASYERLAADYVRALEKMVAEEEEQKRKTADTQESKAGEEKKAGEGAADVEVETVS